jgi:proton-translocating NADH-quinone oxidoreductase chain L
MNYLVQYLWLIPAIPFAASLLILAVGTRFQLRQGYVGRVGGSADAQARVPAKADRRRAAAIAIAGQVSALVLAVIAFGWSSLQAPDWRTFYNFTWFTYGDISVRIGWLLDPLTAAMLLMIALVGLCIFIFSVGYMAEDKHFERFFAQLSFFSAAMLGLVIANSLLGLFICWELVGLASYLLIGFWIEKPSAAAAARKAFITTRIGDIGFFVGLVWLYHTTGTALFYDNGSGSLEPKGLLLLGSSATLVALLIFCGAIGKSGQFPLHVWLPDAMEGPTPVSALIHAATMVAAGVFLVARVYPIFSLGNIRGVTPALTVVVWVGVITALIAALIALGQNDIKRILAYSTVSQLGLMMVSLGVGGVAAGVMHLLAHGFFKALLFLDSGSVIHGCRDEQDIRKLGGLRRLMPVTFAAYGVGMMALSGFPLLFSGGWTKEEILSATQRWSGSIVPYYLMLFGVFLTALYMTRQMMYVFFGKRRGASKRAHESPKIMTIPLIVLATCVVLFSVVLTPAWPWLESYLSGESATLNLGKLIQPILFLSLVLVAGGVSAGVWLYRSAGEIDPLQRWVPALFDFFSRKMWIDELYEKSILAWSVNTARGVAWFDQQVFDGCVRFLGSTAQRVAALTVVCDEDGINRGVDGGCDLTRRLGSRFSIWHSGQIQNYLRALSLGVLGLLILYVWLL